MDVSGGLQRWPMLVEILHILSESNELKHICNNVITRQNLNETASQH